MKISTPLIWVHPRPDNESLAIYRRLMCSQRLSSVWNIYSDNSCVIRPGSSDGMFMFVLRVDFVCIRYANVFRASTALNTTRRNAMAYLCELGSGSGLRFYKTVYLANYMGLISDVWSVMFDWMCCDWQNCAVGCQQFRRTVRRSHCAFSH